MLTLRASSSVLGGESVRRGHQVFRTLIANTAVPVCTAWKIERWSHKVVTYHSVQIMLPSCLMWETSPSATELASCCWLDEERGHRERDSMANRTLQRWSATVSFPLGLPRRERERENKQTYLVQLSYRTIAYFWERWRAVLTTARQVEGHCSVWREPWTAAERDPWWTGSLSWGERQCSLQCPLHTGSRQWAQQTPWRQQL